MATNKGPARCVVLDRESGGVLFQLLETVDRREGFGAEDAVQKDIARDIRLKVLQYFHAGNREAIYDDLKANAKDAVDAKMLKQETTRAVKKMAECSKQIDATVVEWQKDLESGQDEGEDQRKRKLEEIEEKAEDILKVLKKLKKR